MRQKKISYILAILAMLSPIIAYSRSAPWVGTDFKGSPCRGSDTTHWYGPFDYTIPDQKLKLNVVNEYHFTPEVENLLRGRSSYLGEDLNYTLMAGPNHHRALLSIVKMKLELDQKVISFTDKSNLLPSPVECYFYRAMNFSKEDADTYAIFAYFLKKLNKLEEAKTYYEKALEFQPESKKISYSYSLLLIDLKQYDTALEFAKKAYQDKQAPPGLRNKLKSLGKWVD